MKLTLQNKNQQFFPHCCALWTNSFGIAEVPIVEGRWHMCPTCAGVPRCRMAPSSVRVTLGYLSPEGTSSSVAFKLRWPDSRLLQKGDPAYNPWMCAPFASLTRDLVTIWLQSADRSGGKITPQKIMNFPLARQLNWSALWPHSRSIEEGRNLDVGECRTAPFSSRLSLNQLNCILCARLHEQHKPGRPRYSWKGRVLLQPHSATTSFLLVPTTVAHYMSQIWKAKCKNK